MASQQLTLTAPPHHNQRLFSDHYLDQVLPHSPEWRQGGESAADEMARIAEVYERFVPSENEAQTENDLIRPVLSLLGHQFEVQPTLRTPDGTKRPDYVLYRDEATRDANKNVVLTEEALRHGLAVADAKYWDRPLDQALRVGADPFTNKNPGYQIAFYVQHTGLPWGVLTNGRLWRLYHRDTAHKLDCYYEVDLPDLLARNDPSAFQYFLRFFQRSAFEAGPLASRLEEPRMHGLRSALERHLQASATYARTVSESLRDQVYDALRHVAQGFLDFRRNGLQPDPATLRTIYDNALILLYRLLFVLYAEARGLLPVEESAQYRDTYSLLAIKRDVERQITTGRRLLPGSSVLWPRLTQLFEIINEGNPPLQVATFNGGLFDPARHPFLEENTVGDDHLQQAIDKLARVTVKEEGRVFVDYRDLSERHLGTIYEGLLEFRLQPLTTPEEGWSVELVTDRGERKASGSYYTPGFITRFMVEQAVGPVVDAALDRGRAEGPEAQVRAVLNLNVLDCAMGSGHFLVETVEYLSRRLVEADLLPADSARPEFDELAYWKRRVAQSCIYGVDLNPLAVDLAKLSVWLTTAARDRPLSFLDHHLRPGNALVGARMEDLNAAGGTGGKGGRKQDRRGARKRERAEAAGQLSLASDSAFTQSMSRAVGSMWLIEENDAATVADVKSQEALYDQVREAFTRRYSRLADLVTAAHFGMEVDETLWQPLADYASGRTIAPLPQFTRWLEQAQALAEEHRFFHWELEFPEVFFDRFGRALGEEAGFDMVIGNPPYVRQERLAPLKPYLQASFASFHGVADLYLYFYEQGIRLLQQDGRMAYVSSGTFARANFAVAFRKWLPTAGQIETLIDFGENQPFEGAEMVRPSIVVLRKGAQEQPFRGLLIDAEVPRALDEAVEKDGIDCLATALDQAEWTFQSGEKTAAFAKIMRLGSPLGQTVDGRLLYGIKTGLNDAFIIGQCVAESIVAQDAVATSLLKKVVRGQDLRPWYQEDENNWMLTIPLGWTRSRYGDGLSEEEAWSRLSDELSGLADYLSPFRDSARARLDQGDYWWELRSCSYYDAFEGTKIFWPDISKLPRFSWDDSSAYINNTGYVIPTDDCSLLGVLNSRCSWYAISQLSQPLRLRAGLWQYRLLPQFLVRLPIPKMTPEERALVGDLAMQITERARARYALHQRVRHQLQRDLGTPGKALNQKLTAWWALDFSGLRDEVGKVYKRDIPVRERGEWDEWLREQRAEHDRLTGEIIALETELNDRVYRLFDLNADEIRLIEESTKYRYGEV